MVSRGGFKISSRGWQRYLQGVAKIAQGVAKKLRAFPFFSAFFVFYTSLIYAPFLNILDTYYKEIHKIDF